MKTCIPSYNQYIPLMEEILHHLGCIKPCKQWDIYHINWCRISSINSINTQFDSEEQKNTVRDFTKISAWLWQILCTAWKCAQAYVCCSIWLIQRQFHFSGFLKIFSQAAAPSFASLIVKKAPGNMHKWNVRDKPTRLLTTPMKLRHPSLRSRSRKRTPSLYQPRGEGGQICEKAVSIQLHLQKNCWFFIQAGQFQEFESMYLDYFPN